MSSFFCYALCQLTQSCWDKRINRRSGSHMTRRKTVKWQVFIAKVKMTKTSLASSGSIENVQGRLLSNKNELKNTKRSNRYLYYLIMVCALPWVKHELIMSWWSAAAQSPWVTNTAVMQLFCRREKPRKSQWPLVKISIFENLTFWYYFPRLENALRILDNFFILSKCLILIIIIIAQIFII